MLGRLFKRGFNLLSYARLHVRDAAAGRKLTLQQDNLRFIGAGDIILFSRMGDANHPMSFFTDYYRKLGVRHFMFINTNPSDDLPDWSRESDITIWKAAQAENSGFNIHWLNDLLRRYGTGRWNLVVEPGEYFIYAKMETRSLKALVSFLEEERRQTMHAIVLDAYGEAHPDKCDQSASPFETWPLFDRDGYIQSPGLENSTIIRGGPRMRLEHRGQPGQSPNLARIPLVKWKRHFHYKPSGAAALPRLLNRAHSPGHVSPSGALMSFNWISDRQGENASEFPQGELVQESLSVPYSGFRQLQDLGLISPGRWF